METLIFSQTAIFRMQQLASSYFHVTGVRHRMATPEGMVALLNETGQSTDKNVRECFDAFVMELNKRQIDMLTARNVKLRKPQHISVISAVRKAG
ncbi:hypothetical protein [Cellvibrio japonicus]|uniref:Uncharacterized protein n=1 Tax=Cellvibrio japonicus (strain Ueda107) TaxID=498211 RepID=B3PG26_CELJU|nr:hypothetical protein [Cellvibrio japonicus]ACE83306.1 hypothetical protein CJA_3481 [Cellvibrio japonicus Ueda107]QEI13708.1 hypothetical protein FY117_16800 [Cellvibrio japonicus]QEI17282.1 hypothetical protein FY116_16805 [Cellvibrio japonicus]QEI20859.1 hypothetical protein FY115_16800 [Cellvibrio japonicus]